MKRTLASQNYHVLLGPPSKYKLSGSQKSILLWNAGSGGLATITKSHQPMKNIASNGDPFTSGKCTLTWIPTGIGRRGFYLYNVYGYVGAGIRNKVAFANNELLLQQIFEHAACQFFSLVIFKLILPNQKFWERSHPTGLTSTLAPYSLILHGLSRKVITPTLELALILLYAIKSCSLFSKT